MHRFFIRPEDVRAQRAPLNREEAAHALRVLRLKNLAEVQAIDGAGGAWRAILHVEDECWLELLSPLESAEAPARVTLYMGIPKGDKLELIAQKLTELGASRLVPVRMSRCVARIDSSDADKKLARLRRISQEAQKQCGRALEMEIAPPMSFSSALKDISERELALFMWEAAEGTRAKDVCAITPLANDIAYIIGPEGGIAPEEARAIIDSGCVPVTMGRRVLRAETAAIAGCAIIMSLWGDL